VNKNPLIQHITLLQHLCWNASKEKKSAIWLYKQDGRAQFFMLEALCRIFFKSSKYKSFKNWYLFFKQYEDLLGAINCYEELLTKFKENAEIPSDIITYWVSEKKENENKLKNLLKKDKCLQNKLKIFKKKIETSKIKFDNKLILKMEKSIKKELKKTIEEVALRDFQFTQMEDHVHEFRRNIRWLGMYSQALNGIVVLVDNSKTYTWENKYLVSPATKTSFNRLPICKSFEKYIYISKKHFLAFNWLIAELGVLKDIGLSFEMLVIAIRRVDGVDEIEAIARANNILKPKVTNEDVLLRTSAIVREFFEDEKIHKELFLGEL